MLSNRRDGRVKRELEAKTGEMLTGIAKLSGLESKRGGERSTCSMSYDPPGQLVLCLFRESKEYRESLLLARFYVTEVDGGREWPFIPHSSSSGLQQKTQRGQAWQ